jgi:hypothetical protein
LPGWVVVPGKEFALPVPKCGGGTRKAPRAGVRAAAPAGRQLIQGCLRKRMPLFREAEGTPGKVPRLVRVLAAGAGAFTGPRGEGHHFCKK